MENKWYLEEVTIKTMGQECVFMIWILETILTHSTSPGQIIAKVLKTIIAAVLMEFHGLQMVQELRKPLEPTTRGFTFGLLI